VAIVILKPIPCSAHEVKVLTKTFKCLILPNLKSVVDIVYLIQVIIVVFLHSAGSYTVTFYTAILD
jgi:hypothetical protein